ncbi:E3 ubiquitin-protein ligase RSL1-like [Henckelia pumila]|uniref:E3 ubiquitin-protein ligase RSL1-like n=1 Tax=Henckelia pumila TaxID=405737 RepID=UPI003C6E9302
MENSPTLADNPSPSDPANAQHHVEGMLRDHAGDSDQEFTCEICIEPTLVPDKRFENGDKCAHPFCTDCVIKYIRVKLEDDNAGRIKCPALNCDHTLDPLACATLVGPSLFTRWCDVLCEAAISGVDKCYCPYRNCNLVILDECGEDPRKSRCPNCKRWFCFRCKTGWHAGFRCEDMGEVRDANDLAFGGLVERMGWRRCPSCRHFVERLGGCKSVRCRCGMDFCYTCGQQCCPCRNGPFYDGESTIYAIVCLYYGIFAICLFILWLKL